MNKYYLQKEKKRKYFVLSVKREHSLHISNQYETLIHRHFHPTNSHSHCPRNVCPSRDGFSDSIVSLTLYIRSYERIRESILHFSIIYCCHAEPLSSNKCVEVDNLWQDCAPLWVTCELAQLQHIEHKSSPRFAHPPYSPGTKYQVWSKSAVVLLWRQKQQRSLIYRLLFLEVRLF